MIRPLVRLCGARPMVKIPLLVDLSRLPWCHARAAGCADVGSGHCTLPWMNCWPFSRCSPGDQCDFLTRSRPAEWVEFLSFFFSLLLWPLLPLNYFYNSPISESITRAFRKSALVASQWTHRHVCAQLLSVVGGVSQTSAVIMTGLMGPMSKQSWTWPKTTRKWVTNKRPDTWKLCLYKA